MNTQRQNLKKVVKRVKNILRTQKNNFVTVKDLDLSLLLAVAEFVLENGVV